MKTGNREMTKKMINKKKKTISKKKKITKRAKNEKKQFFKLQHIK